MGLPSRLALLVTLAMTAFAANSLLCRLALKQTAIDAGSFTALRILSGAATLWLIVRLRGGAAALGGNWRSALALFGYAAGFSYAYVQLPTATGALLLFGAVQTTMIGSGLWRGERLAVRQTLGLCLALAGLVCLLLPGLAAPPPGSSALMLAAGVAWGVYSLRGKGSGSPTLVTAGNFLRAVPCALLLWVCTLPTVSLDGPGVCYALLSGGLASGLGYLLWYGVLPGLTATNAATVQLTVPVIAALGGVLFLGETITLRLLASSAAILGGIALVIRSKRNASP
jgi:drug/metabolite transporter (DMT)-like permease